ncbi:MAG TPA: Ku protein [Solirubrobacteraceae bacterium]|jgi:DNA end-binding protein Ku
MPRPIWSGAISFGLVTVPVKLYSAVSQQTIRFHQLHAGDHVRIQQKRVCPADGQEVAYQEIVKGYEISPDHYVVIEPEELEALEPQRSHTIEIEDFVEISEIDPLYYDHPYYLAPGPGGLKPYELLASAMRETERIAVGRVVLRNREQLVCIRALERGLAMTTMNFADEVLAIDRLKELPDEQGEISEREHEIACRLIESLSASFEPSKYRDTYRERVLDLIERKAQGKQIAHTPPAPAPTTQAPDLMSALKASLEEARGRPGSSPKASSKRKRTPAGGSKRAAAVTPKPKPKPKSSARAGSGGSSRRG